MQTADSMIRQYRVLGPLGKGGMGEVFLAEDSVLDRKVAIKFLPESMQQDSEARHRFLREAKAAAALDHPFICRVYETGEASGKAFIVMEYVTGETLKDRLQRGALPLKEALDIAIEIAEALGEAHAKGIIHRDVKPANIMLPAQGHAKIMDFGLAKITSVSNPDSEATASSLDNLTRTGTVLGTTAYMSPEQARGAPVDSRSDIFSFGMVLFEMLTGQNPFLRQSQIDTLSAIIRDPSPPLQLEPGVPPNGLEAILNRAMAKKPEERYQDIRELGQDLKAFRDQLLPKKRPAWMVGALSSAALLVAILICVVLWFAFKAPKTVPLASHAPVSVLIADFENRTGDPVFNSVLEKGLELGLESAPFITSYKRSSAIEEARAITHTNDDRINTGRALLVAQRNGINLVLAGAIEKAGSGFRISVSATDPFTGKQSGSEEIKCKTKEDVLGGVATLALRLRKQLGDTQAASTETIARETFTANSLEAARRYAVAQDLIAAGKYRQAIEAYQSVLEIDPDLGRAYAGMAAASANLNRYEESKKYYQEAMKRIDRMTEREKHRTLGTYYVTIGDSQSAIRELKTLVDRFPADEAGLTNLAYAYFLARDMAAAMERGAAAVKIYPKNMVARGNLALYAMYAGNFDFACAEAAKAIELNPGFAPAHTCLAMSELARGRPVQAEEAYQKLAGIGVHGASLSAMGLADMDLYRGRLADARSILELGIAGDVSGKNPDSGRKLAALAGARLVQGKITEAVQAAERAVKVSSEPRVLYEAANVYLDSGRISDALSLAKTLDANLEPDIQAYAHLVLARAELKQGEREKGIAELEDTYKAHDIWLVHYELGRAYLDAGKFPEAYTQFEQCLKRRGEATAVFLDDVPTLRYIPPVYYYLGRAQEGLHSPGAVESYRSFLAIKEKGGEDPLLAEVRRRLKSR